jgi:hypothetical protein
MLPSPTTGPEMYLAAVLGELRSLRADIQALKPEPPAASQLAANVVDIREPAGTPIPENFPGGEALFAAGINTLERIPRDGDALTAIRGVGKLTAGRILETLR